MQTDNNDDQVFSIGAAARAVGVTPHVLRKWQSRYGIVEPHRGKNGRRTYSHEQVNLLVRVKSLMGAGISLQTLSGKSLTELDALSVSGRTSQVRVFGSPFIEGSRPEVSSNDGLTLVFEEQPWQEGIATSLETSDSSVLEIPHLDADAAKELLSSLGSNSACTYIVYRYAHPGVLASLKAAGMKAYRGPLSIRVIADLIGNQKLQADPQQAPLRPIEPRQYSEATIRLAADYPNKLACECPRNIANILSDLYAFENYSLECITSQPHDREIHEHLYQVTANARSLFERALGKLAKHEHEGINLDIV
jgi:hypothetical protein